MRDIDGDVDRQDDGDENGALLGGVPFSRQGILIRGLTNAG